MSAPRVEVAGRSASLESRRRRRRAAARHLLAAALGGALVVGAGSTGVAPAVVAAAGAVAAAAFLWPSPAGRWAAGAAGERATARALEGIEDEGYTVVHDVRLPGRRWNLDHVLLGPAGVVIVDSKQWRTPVTVRRRWPRVVEEHVGWQIDAVVTALGAHGHHDTTVHGFVCVHGAPVRRSWWTGARNAPIGDARHLRRWLRRLPRGLEPDRKVFKSWV